jgi:type II secretory pathway component PulF
VPIRNTASLLGMLSARLASGRTLAASLEEMEPGLPRRLRARVAAARAMLATDATVAEAFRKSSVLVDDLFVSVIEAGDRAGRLANATLDIANELRASEKDSREYRSLVNVCFFGGLAALALQYLLGRFAAEMFCEGTRDSGMTLPFSTLIVLGLMFLVDAYRDVLPFVRAVAKAQAVARNDRRSALARRWILVHRTPLNSAPCRRTIWPRCWRAPSRRSRLFDVPAGRM